MTIRLPSPSWVLAAGFACAAAGLGLLAGRDPGLAITAGLAIVFILLAFTNLTAGLVAFALLAFLEFVFPASSAVSLTKVAGAVLALSWLATVSTSDDRRTLFSDYPATIYLLAGFLSWGVISTLWADDPSKTFDDLTRYLSVFVLFVITYTAVASRREAASIFGIFLAGTVVTAGYGLVTRPSGGSGDPFRVASTVGDPNVLATVLVAGLVIALGAAVALRRAPGLRLASLGVAGLCALTFVLTGSRGGVLSLAAVLVVAVVVAGRWRAQVLAGAVSVAIATTLLFAAFAPAEIKDRVTGMTTGETRSTEGRVTLWEVGWRMVEDRPLTGVGLGNFQASSKRYLDQPGLLGRTDQVIDEPLVAHNIYLQSLAETGVVGTALFLGLLGFPIGCALVAARNFARAGDWEMELMARTLVVALAGFLVAEFFVSEPFNKLLWLLLGLGPAMLAISNRGVKTGGQRHDRLAAGRRASA